jgi:hypothetical protein
MTVAGRVDGRIAAVARDDTNSKYKTNWILRLVFAVCVVPGAPTARNRPA